MQPLKPGIHLLLKRTQAPVVPVGIAGAYQAYPRTRLLPTLAPLFWPANGCAVGVSVGRPLPAQRYGALPRARALEELFQELRAVRERAERLRRKP